MSVGLLGERVLVVFCAGFYFAQAVGKGRTRKERREWRRDLET
jgi:hypothetical protein